jgi:hypothetical protein
MNIKTVIMAVGLLSASGAFAGSSTYYQCGAARSDSSSDLYMLSCQEYTEDGGDSSYAWFSYQTSNAADNTWITTPNDDACNQNTPIKLCSGTIVNRQTQKKEHCMDSIDSYLDISDTSANKLSGWTTKNGGEYVMFKESKGGLCIYGPYSPS